MLMSGPILEVIVFRMQGKFLEGRYPMMAAQANEKLGKLIAAAELYEAALLMQPNELWIGNTQQQAQEQALQALGVRHVGLGFRCPGRAGHQHVLDRYPVRLGPHPLVCRPED